MFASRRAGLLAPALLLAFSALTAQAQTLSAGTAVITAPAPAKELIPVGDFFRHSRFGAAVLSPDGRNVAMSIADEAGTLVLVLLPLDTREPKILVRAASDVAQIRWVNDKRIAFTFADRRLGQGDQYMGPGLFAINIDGTGQIELATRDARMFTNGERNSGRSRSLGFRTAMLGNPGKQDSDSMYVTQVSLNGTSEAVLDLLKLDTVTGESTKVRRPGRAVAWLLDESGEPGIAVTNEGPVSSTYYFDPKTSNWRLLFANDDRTLGAMTPFAMGPDGKLFVYAHNGRDKRALYRFDIASGKLEAEPVVDMPDYDFEGTVSLKEGRVVGVHYETDAPGTLWLDPQRAALQKEVDALLPATVNMLSFPRRPATPYILVRSFSDREPGSVALYNVETKKLSVLGRPQPQIDPARMAEKEPVRYQARDGMTIPAYLTLPPNAKKNLPLVVLVHGGPWVRGGHWNFDPQGQFLASRGYAVLEPDYRGSTGYGLKHFHAGFKQWGLAMQDDVADGVRWAVAQGIADPKRVCIAGASYGGYAVLMGLINDPDVYKCGISWAGVTDIDLFYDVHWSDISESYKQYGMPVMVGDQKKDAAQLKATSPVAQAARIRQPLMLAYGGADIRVPLVHGTTFRDAVKATNPNVEWIVYPEEGHGWRLEANNVDFWTRVEKFLGQHIGPGTAK